MNKVKVRHTEAKMEGGGIVRNFWIIDNIQSDYERFNWDTLRYEQVESKTSQQYFITNLQGLTAGDTVNLYINCMGGSVKEALGIHSVLQRCPATVIAYIDGYAASAASVVAMAASKIIMPRNTAMMIHNAAWWAYGNPAELRKSADDLEVINMAAIQSYCMHAGDKLPRDKLQQMLDAETWLTAEDCINYGLADEFAAEAVTQEHALEMFNAGAESAKNTPDAWLFRTVPAFLDGAYTVPTAQGKEPPPKEPVPKEPEPHNPSSIYMLLKSMTE